MLTSQTADRLYSFRASRWSRETAYRLGRDVLHWQNVRGQGGLPHANIRRVRVYKIRYFGSRASYWRCDLTYTGGAHLRLQAAHYAGGGRIEDRSEAYIPFIKQLESRLAQANPDAIFEAASQRFSSLDAAIGLVTIVTLKILRLIDVRHTANTAAWIMRKIGPRLKGHRVARANLIAAYPEKSAPEIERILRGMWDNIGRVFVEYAHLDRLWDFDPTGEPNHILIDGDDRRRFLAAMSEKGPALFFGAHLGNWELLPFAIGSHPGDAAVVYRPSQIASIEQELSKIRARSKAGLIGANTHAFFLARDLMRRGGLVGIVVDEHFPRGIDVEFFGRPCKVSPLFARLARQFDCPIYGGAVVRLGEQKFRLLGAGPLAAPRDADGKIDVASTMQMITQVIEEWIKEYPEQWLWIQRRWRNCRPN